jgi:hypothetical protein
MKSKIAMNQCCENAKCPCVAINSKANAIMTVGKVVGICIDAFSRELFTLLPFWY